jgi:photosystem II stability/assembly factor-like uncharacterized protein
MTRRLAGIAALATTAALLVPLTGHELLHTQSSPWTPLSTGVTARLRGLSAVSPRVAWASGTGGTVIRTEDGGATWARSTIPDSEALDFRDVDAVDERTAYVLSIGDGDASRIYKTTDAGRTWTLQFRNTDKLAFYDAMAFRDARHGFAFSDSVAGRLVIIRTDDGGAHWHQIARGLPPALENEGAFAASGTNIAISGDRIWIATSRSRVLMSTDDGRTWNAVSTPVPNGPSAGLFSIAFASRDRGIVAGGDYKAEAGTADNAAVTSDGGRTWTVVKGLGGFRSAVGYVAASSGAKEGVIAVGPNGSDYSSDGGRTWSPLGGPGFHTLSVARGSRTVFAAGEKGAVSTATF